MEETKPAPHGEAELRKVVHGIVSEVVEQKELERQDAYERASRRGPKLTALLALALVLLVAWIALSTFIPAARRVRVMPDELLGYWTTTSARYAGRALEIQKSSLIFHTGDGGFTTHPVQQVRSQESDTLALYRVDYLADDVVYTLSFYYQPAPFDRIRFENQLEMVWSR